MSAKYLHDLTRSYYNNNNKNEPIQYIFNQYNFLMLHNAKVIKKTVAMATILAKY